METSELLRRVRKIEIKTRGLSNHLFSGGYHAMFKGRGMSFSEVREYQYGDDVRAIDWNVTARTNHPYIKVFEEERELTAMLLVDASGSAFFGTQPDRFKNEMTTELAAVLAFSASSNNDKVGVIFYTDRIEKFIPPKKGRQHVLRIIRELIDFKPEGKGSDIGLAFRYLDNVLKKRCIVFALSDYFAENYETPLRIAARRHDVVGLRLHDPAEQMLPDIGLAYLTDPETNEARWVNTSDKEVRRAFLQWYGRYDEYFKKSFVQAGADQLSLTTKDSYVKSLLNFFKSR